MAVRANNGARSLPLAVKRDPVGGSENWTRMFTTLSFVSPSLSISAASTSDSGNGLPSSYSACWHDCGVELILAVHVSWAQSKYVSCW